jgi:hypothetical protein
MNHKELTLKDIMAISGNYWSSCTLHAGVKLDLFTIINDKKIEAKFLAEKLDADLHGMKVLLNALCAMGLLDKSDGCFSNTPLSRVFLCTDSKEYKGNIIMHHHHLMASWNQLGDIVISGGPVKENKKSLASEEKRRESFLLGMFNTAMLNAPKIVPLVDFSFKKSLLDLAGGPGTYAIQFCMKNPDLNAIVFDLPTTEPYFDRTVQQFNMEKRIKFKAGDLLTDDIGEHYDAAWLSHILHSESSDVCYMFIQKVFDSLEPGGQIVIHDFILNKDKTTPEFPALFSLNMFLRTKYGRSYSKEEIVDMLEKAGFENIKHILYDNPNSASLLCAQK